MSLPENPMRRAFLGQATSRTVLLTGATGVVGRRLLPRLVRDGHAVCAASRSAIEVPAGARVAPIGDIGPNTSWSDALAGCDCVIHLAATTPAKGVPAASYDTVNDQGTARLVEQALAAKVKLFILISSVYAVVDGLSAMPLDDAAEPRPSTPYGLSKLAAERHVARFSSADRVSVTLRPPLVYAADARNNWNLLQRLAASRLPLPFGRIDTPRSLIAVENLVDAIAKVVACRHDKLCSGVFFVADSEPVGLQQVITYLRHGMGRRDGLWPVPPKAFEWLLPILPAGMRRVLFGNLIVDWQRFGTCYDWKPPVPSSEAIARSGREFLARRNATTKPM